MRLQELGAPARYAVGSTRLLVEAPTAMTPSADAGVPTVLAAGPGVAGGGDHDNAGPGGGGRGQAERIEAVAVAAEAHVDDVGAVRVRRVGRRLDARDDVGGVTLAPSSMTL